MITLEVPASSRGYQSVVGPNSLPGVPACRYPTSYMYDVDYSGSTIHSTPGEQCIYLCVHGLVWS